jgi:hypothetical protein
MKFRHAAALALVGWYLLAPSKCVLDAAGGGVLTDWVRLGVFETATQCDHALKTVQMEIDAAHGNERHSGRELNLLLGEEAECTDSELDSSLSNLPVGHPLGRCK